MNTPRRAIARASITLALALTAGCGTGEQSPDERETAARLAAAPKAFAVCASCHAVVPGRNRIGPSLAGVWGRKAASVADYDYSLALRNAGIVWDDASLDRWLQGPVKMVPGAKMVIGVSDPQGRRSVIAYLKTLK